MKTVAKTSQEHKSKKRIRAVLFFLLFFLAWAIYTSYEQWTEIQQKKKTIEKLNDQQTVVQQEKQKLEKQMFLLQKDDYIAEIARKYYFLSKPGEYIFISPEQ